MIIDTNGFEYTILLYVLCLSRLVLVLILGLLLNLLSIFLYFHFIFFVGLLAIAPY